MNNVPRGIRNNNPLNIRVGNKWLGEVEYPTDNEFEQFVNIEYGLRAGFVLLKRYIERYKLNTIEKIISRWAPASENNTKKYINHICKALLVDEDVVLNFKDIYLMTHLVYEMCIVENGEPVELDKICVAYYMV